MVKLILDKGNIEKLEIAIMQSTYLLMEEFKNDIEREQVVPFRTGTLKDSVVTFFDTNKAAIGWDTPYARRLYFHPEYNFRKDKHANAQGLWLDLWIRGEKKNWLAETYAKILKDRAGGIIK